MPVTIAKTYAYKALPVTFRADGAVEVTIRAGFQEPDGFHEKEFIPYTISAADAQAVMSRPGNPNLSRAEDLLGALYQYLIDKGVIEGAISA